MTRLYVTLALLASALALVATGCGSGSGDVPDDAIAVVDGTEIPRSELDALVEQAKVGFEAQSREYPKVGTQEYLAYQQQFVAFLVQKAQFDQAAKELGVKITDADIEKVRKDLVKERFSGDEEKLAAEVKKQGLSDEAFLETLRVSVLSTKLFDAVTKDVKVTDSDALSYYTQNQEQYGSPESRDVRHILIAEQVDPSCQPSPPTTQCEVDFAKSKQEADRIYGLLQDGGDFAELAKQYSDDPGSASSGGKYTAVRGASVPEFDKAAFALETNEISKPVKTQYGYHVIQPIADTKPANVTPFPKVKAAIKSLLLQDKRNQAMTQWVKDLQNSYEGKVTYATGFEPPEIPDSTETVTQ
jgi:parvulin-like peptidyl-prolyl isomerase